ncbi:hypothetical protein K8R42_01185 [bacterium]|nr:hypothetical protein [bacterium]
MPFRQDPLAVLARTDPDGVRELLYRQMDLEKVQARTGMIRSLGNNHAAMACTWLQHRSPNEQNMEIVTDSGSNEAPTFFGLFGGSGERAWMRTRISIW